MPLSVEVGTPLAGRVPIVLSGDLDQNTAGQLRAAAGTALHQRPTVLCVDFTLVRFMDSSGLGTLIAVKRWCDEVGCALSLEGLSRTVHQRFQLSGLTDMFGLPTSPA